ncbi:DNA mismatch endonuclease Vsr [Methylobacterium sp. J-078]|uniref:very short patch repair endonuclease n=1 Tax=Methylobacterium sp. J-078 TaxID=2836657 RepID=UPI001FBB49FA|nr:DNA mismatch endonuclease Vsr [Methylobacterium sp. J-078]MCJ2044612.1 DNA mismatch endonuclease Vsr [Methylobacterium sp. J-078]
MKAKSDAPITRSENMSRIRGKDTKPEMRVRKLVHALGFRFRLHRRDLPGTPDLTFPGRQAVIFVHGCFWHRHSGCVNCTTPKTRVAFWSEKFAKNVERDRRAVSRLQDLGWRVLTVWECEISDEEALQSRIIQFLGAPVLPLNLRNSGRDQRKF